jgi:hypothetical protein
LALQIIGMLLDHFAIILLVDSKMVFINNLNDVTLAPSNAGPQVALQATARMVPGQSFEQARANNLIYQNNGLICQRRMCNAMTGCEDVIECAKKNPSWKQISEFCGPVGTPAMSMDGSYWIMQPADSQQKAVARTEKAIGMSPLPTAYNVQGMYLATCL